MLSAAPAVNQPKGTKVKNTFIDLDDSEDECPAHSRRGFLTMPDMPERSLGGGDGFQEQPSPEPSPVAAGEGEPVAQPFEEPSPAHNPTLLGALQRKLTADLPDQKVVVKNTFIDAQEEPDASPSPTAGHARRLTCPAVWPSMGQGDDSGSLFHTEAAAEPEASSDDDGGAPRTHAQRWASMQTEDLRDHLAEAAAAGQPPEPAGAASRSRASSRGGGRRVSFPKELAGGDPEDSGGDTPRGPRRGGAFDTQDLRESLLQGNLPELEAGPAGQPQTPSRVPVSLFAAGAGAAPGAAPLPTSPFAPHPTVLPQAFQSPGHGAPQPGAALLSLLSAVATGADPAGHPAPPMAPAAPLSPGAVPVSLLQAVNQVGALGSAAAATGPTSPAAAAAAAAQLGSPSLPPPGQGFAYGPGAWSMLGPCGYHCGAQMPWAQQWPWYGVPPAGQPAAGPQAPPPIQPAGLGGTAPAPMYGQAPPQVQGHAQAAAQAAADAARAEHGDAPPHVQSAAQAAAQAAAAAARAAAAAGGAAPQPEASEAPAQRATTARGGRRLRLWAHIYLHMQVPGFDLVPRLIGRNGCNMRRIFEATSAKVRIRGRGSGHKEGDSHTEAPTPLMVAVTTDKGDVQGFRAAMDLVIRDLRSTEQRFQVFCEKQKIRHEGPCFSFGLLPEEARQCLGALCDGVPMATGSRHPEA